MQKVYRFVLIFRVVTNENSSLSLIKIVYVSQSVMKFKISKVKNIKYIVESRNFTWSLKIHTQFWWMFVRYSSLLGCFFSILSKSHKIPASEHTNALLWHGFLLRVNDKIFHKMSTGLCSFSSTKNIIKPNNRLSHNWTAVYNKSAEAVCHSIQEIFHFSAKYKIDKHL